MTTPPHQTPGGFGAPQQPNQPPQQPNQAPAQPNQPPQQPGYGYPQPGQPAQPAQPGPYGQPGPYAQPQPGAYGAPQGPNPYAQPQPGPYGAQPQPNPYAQQPAGPYGQPPQPGPYGAPPVPPAGGGTPRKKLTAIIAASVVGVLVISAGAYFAFGRNGDDPKKPVAQNSSDAKPSASPSVEEGDGSGDGGENSKDLNAGRKPGEDKVLWLKMNEQDVPGDGADASGMWVAGDTVAKVAYKTVSGYSVKDGRRTWSVVLDGEICGVPRQTTADHKVVVAFKKAKNCNQLRLIDLAAGTAGWTKEVPREGLFDIMTRPGLAIHGDIVTVARSGPSSAFKISDGSKVWARAEGNCLPDAYAGGSKLIGSATCTPANGTYEDRQEQLEGTDPATGKPTWTYKLPKGWRINKIYSVDPVVADLDNSKAKKRAVVILRANGTLRSQLSSKDDFQASCGWSVLNRDPQNCIGAVVDGDTFYFPTTGSGSGGNDNAVVAFNLDTGKEKWRAKASEGRRLVPLKAEGGKVYAYSKPTFDKGGEVVAITPGGGKPRAVLRNPTPAKDVEDSFYDPEIQYVDGRLFISVTRLLGKDDAQEKLMIVFGK
ncbi:PQQ-binding-like beta-propeller repeat protein [Streptomyces sp. NPDC093225]|uniref:outer membrane protein assembly factor BamB family protein n=1 Tax=Streptomyces sp. NPDC093225 TaxID=3366034 RepID=UPI0037FA470D